MSMNAKWKKDLALGNLGEKVIAKYLRDNHGYKFISMNNTIEYDFILEKDEEQIQFEVKTDRWEHYTGITTNNMFLEIRCNGKFSGIRATTAKYFIYYFPDHEKAYMIEVKELLRLIQYNQELFTRREQSGDGGKVIGYTLNRIKNEKLFTIFDIKKGPYWS